MPSSAEVARIVVGLIEAGEQRMQAMGPLAEAMEQMSAEFDPDHEQNGTDWESFPAWVNIGGYGKLRKAYERLVRLEQEAAEVAVDLHGMLNLAAPGTSARPLGLTARAALAETRRISDMQTEVIDFLNDDSRSPVRAVRPRLSDETVAALREAIRGVARAEAHTRRELTRLMELAAS